MNETYTGLEDFFVKLLYAHNLNDIIFSAAEQHQFEHVDGKLKMTHKLKATQNHVLIAIQAADQLHKAGMTVGEQYIISPQQVGAFKNVLLLGDETALLHTPGATDFSLSMTIPPGKTADDFRDAVGSIIQKLSQPNKAYEPYADNLASLLNAAGMNVGSVETHGHEYVVSAKNFDGNAFGCAVTQMINSGSLPNDNALYYPIATHQQDGTARIRFKLPEHLTPVDAGQSYFTAECDLRSDNPTNAHIWAEKVFLSRRRSENMIEGKPVGSH